ncbi:hypothetical protein EDD36DRAFT_447721 [Exophiala viscosa]|uniref:Uncharacterized protein n=1 Tax=Exophiala viscosa TaxID=2486360 RepID=A0AAN6DP44_9EURO|nr:hypothetical protein EDD36DRAFT_447721 [Exophiala viscosa]
MQNVTFQSSAPVLFVHETLFLLQILTAEVTHGSTVVLKRLFDVANFCTYSFHLLATTSGSSLNVSQLSGQIISIP